MTRRDPNYGALLRKAVTADLEALASAGDLRALKTFELDRTNSPWLRALALRYQWAIVGAVPPGCCPLSDGERRFTRLTSWTLPGLLWLVRTMAAEIRADCRRDGLDPSLTACAAMAVRELRCADE